MNVWVLKVWTQSFFMVWYDIWWGNYVYPVYLSSTSQYYPVRHSADYSIYSGSPQYVEEYNFHPPVVLPDTLSSFSAVGGYDPSWTVQEKRLTLRDGFSQPYGNFIPRDQWGQQYYGGGGNSMRRLSIQPRSRSMPRSPSSSSGGPFSPVPPNFVSPARSSSGYFNLIPRGIRDDMIYDPSAYSLRRSFSSPKVKYKICKERYI